MKTIKSLLNDLAEELEDNRYHEHDELSAYQKNDIETMIEEEIGRLDVLDSDYVEDKAREVAEEIRDSALQCNDFKSAVKDILNEQIKSVEGFKVSYSEEKIREEFKKVIKEELETGGYIQQAVKEMICREVRREIQRLVTKGVSWLMGGSDE